LTPPVKVLQLIERFERNLDKYKRPDYKEARVCAEFIDPFLEKLWGGTRATREGAASTRICPTTRIESPPIWGEWLPAAGRQRLASR